MRKAFAFVLLIAVALVLTLIGGIGVKNVRAQQPPLKAFQVWVHLENKSRNEGADNYFARRSDGASVWIQSDGVTSLDLTPNGIAVSYSNRNSNITTRGRGKPAVATDFKEDCSDAVISQVIPGETKNILGFDTLHVALTNRESSGLETHISKWYAPALNCFALEEETAYYRDGKAIEVETITAMKVTPGEPPEDVFKMPTGVETPPSEFYAALRPSASDPAISCGMPPRERMDAHYYQDKAAREGR
jgi:hypothetical protein